MLGAAALPEGAGEAPSPAVDEALRERLGSAAVAAAQAIGYVGAGTVEFVLAPDGDFFFLEVNTRLQVEHPVTELVTGLDLVRVQLQVAEGLPLPPEVVGARVTGHAIEARLNAEDVPAGYLPVTGSVHRFAVPALPGVRVDSGVADGSVVGVHYDSMLAKVIAHGATRDDACRRLARALAEAQVHGITTNRDLLVGVLREAEFRAGEIDTGYLERHPELTSPVAGTRRSPRCTRPPRCCPTPPSGGPVPGCRPPCPAGGATCPAPTRSPSSRWGRRAGGAVPQLARRWRVAVGDARLTVDGVEAAPATWC